MDWHKKRLARWIASCVAALVFLTSLEPAGAHCDTLDGPVVKAARQALDTGNVNLVLIWVRESDEKEIKDAFWKTLRVRKLNPTAKDLADNFFFETLVRVHRAGEGASYTGLKAAGADLGPAIPAGDRALETKSADAVARLLVDQVRLGLEDHFKEVTAKATFSKNDVAAGRAFVHAYVEYIHYVERIYEDSTSPAHGHYAEPVASEAHAQK